MKPPERLSPHSTCRTLVTRASRVRPSTSKRMVSPTLIPKRSRMLSSIDTSVTGIAPAPARGRRSRLSRGVSPERAIDDALVGLERGAVGDGVFARQRAAPAHVLVVLELNLAALDRHDPGPQDRNQARRRRTRLLPGGDDGAHGVHLIRLDVQQEHVGGVGRHVHRELRNQVLLQRANADDEEAAQPHGQEDDANLAAWTAELQHSVAEREPSRFRERPDQFDQQDAGQIQHQRGSGQTHRHDQPDAPRPGLPHRQQHQRGGHKTNRRNLHGIEPALSGLVAQQPRRLDMPHVEQRHQCEQQGHQQPDAQPLQNRRPRHAVVDRHSGGGRRSQRRRNRRDGGGREQHAQRAPARPSTTTCAR